MPKTHFFYCYVARSTQKTLLLLRAADHVENTSTAACVLERVYRAVSYQCFEQISHNILYLRLRSVRKVKEQYKAGVKSSVDKGCCKVSRGPHT
jgi:hypothetical protein